MDPEDINFEIVIRRIDADMHFYEKDKLMVAADVEINRSRKRTKCLSLKT